jgi:hypothetical protein
MISGFFQSKEKSNSLAILLFICSIVFDRNVLLANKDSIFLDLIISQIFFKQVPSDVLFNSIPFQYKIDPKLYSLLSSVSTVHSSEQIMYFGFVKQFR